MMHAIPHAVFLHVEADSRDAGILSDALARVTRNIRIRRVSAAETAKRVGKALGAVLLGFVGWFFLVVLSMA